MVAAAAALEVTVTIPPGSTRSPGFTAPGTDTWLQLDDFTVS
jgi:hypothetical protein